MLSRRVFVTLAGAGLLRLALPSASAAEGERVTALLGRWDLNVHSEKGDYPAWLEVRRSGRSLVGSFVGQFGSARPIGRVEFENGRLRFAVPPQFEPRKDDLRFEGRIEGDTLRGETTDDKGHRLEWTARRAPSRCRPASAPWHRRQRLRAAFHLVLPP